MRLGKLTDVSSQGIQRLLKSGLRSRKTFGVIVWCAAALSLVVAGAPPEDLSLKITILAGEHSRDSNSTTTTLAVEGNKLVYEQTYHGFRANRRGPVRKEYKLTANDRSLLIKSLRQKNLLVNKSLNGLPEEPAARLYFTLLVNSKLDGREYSVTIDGARDDLKLKEADLYRDSVVLIEQLYQIINRTDPDMRMPRLID